MPYKILPQTFSRKELMPKKIKTPSLKQCSATLNILVKKHYKQTTVKKEDWPKLLEMLDAAYNFSQKKVLLKKL